MWNSSELMECYSPYFYIRLVSRFGFNFGLNFILTYSAMIRFEVIAKRGIISSFEL